MNVAYETLDAVHGKITVTIGENDYAAKVADQLKQIRKTHSEPGFRPGKVPAGLINKKYGDAVKYDVVNKEVGNAIFEYIKENKLNVLGNPVPAPTNDFDLSKADFTLDFIVGITPEIDDHVNKDLHVPYYKIQVSDEMVNNQDNQMRRRLGKQEPGDEADATALVKGVITELNEDGSVKEGGVTVENGIVAPQYFKSDDQRNLFIGCHVGDHIVFNPAATCDGNATELSSMLGIDKADAEAHKGDFSMDVKEIIVLKPAELGEEYYKEVFGAQTEIKDEEEYRQALRNMLADALTNDSNYRFSIDAKEAVLNAVGDLQLPDDILKDFLVAQNEALNAENIETEYTAARPSIVWDLISNEIARRFELKVEEQDMLEVAGVIARQQFAQYGIRNISDEMIDKYAHEILNDKKSRQHVAQQTFDMKLYNTIHENVTLDEKEVSVEEFNKLFTPAEMQAEGEKAAEAIAE